MFAREWVVLRSSMNSLKWQNEKHHRVGSADPNGSGILHYTFKLHLALRVKPKDFHGMGFHWILSAGDMFSRFSVWQFKGQVWVWRSRKQQQKSSLKIGAEEIMVRGSFFRMQVHVRCSSCLYRQKKALYYVNWIRSWLQLWRGRGTRLTWTSRRETVETNREWEKVKGLNTERE